MDLSAFADKWKDQDVNFTKSADEYMRKLFIQAGSNVILANPVKTGWSRSNWFGNINTDSKSINTRSESEVEIMNATSLAMTNITRTAGSYKVGAGGIYLINNVNYVPDLDKGKSKQANAGYVLEGIRNALEQMEQSNHKFIK